MSMPNVSITVVDKRFTFYISEMNNAQGFDEFDHKSFVGHRRNVKLNKPHVYSLNKLFV